jgi:hypothetical protein
MAPILKRRTLKIKIQAEKQKVLKVELLPVL